MEKAIRIIAAFAVTGCALASAAGQSNESPIRWNFSAIPINEKEARLIFTANLEDGWHIYSQFLEEGGPLPTTFTFTPDRAYSLKGKVKEESTPVEEFDGVFMMNIVWYKDTAVFSQEVKLNVPATTIKGKIEFMGCNSFMCLPPDEVSFSVEVKAAPNDKHSKGK